MMNNTKMCFDVDANQIKIKKLLKKDFLELSMKAISSAHPNRNNSWFTPESMEKSLPSFYNKPILGYFENGDFVSHNGTMNKDTELNMTYWDTLGAQGERILGLIRSEDEVKIIEENGLSWITLTCALWTQYSFKQVKRLLKDAIRSQKNGEATKNISVEIDVLDYDIMPDGVMKINEFKLVGITILGSRNGKKVEPGIENAELSVLDMIDSETYSKQSSELRMAYEKLGSSNEDIKKEERSVEIIDNNNPVEKIQETPVEKFEEEPCAEKCEEQKCEEKAILEEKSAEVESKENCEVIKQDEDHPEDEQGDDHDDDHDDDDEDRDDDDSEHMSEEECDECKEDTPESEILYDFTWMISNHVSDQNNIKRVIEYYENHKELKNADYILAVLNRLLKIGQKYEALLAECLVKAAEDISQEDIDRENELIEYEDCEKLCNSCKELELKCQKLEESNKKCEEEKIECEKLCNEQAEQLAKYAKSEFLQQAKTLIYSSGLDEKESQKFYGLCDTGKYLDINTLKIDIAVALFERDHKSIGNTDVSLPINNPAVFTNDGAEKSNVKLSSWDKLKAYSTGNK